MIERELVLLATVPLAWGTYRFVEMPIRFGKPGPRKVAAVCAAMVAVACAGGAVVWGRGFDFRLPAEIRSLASVPAQLPAWRFNQCLLDLSRQTSFAEDCADRGPRPLILVWGDSTAAALMPGLRKAQETRSFGIAQFTSSSCIPAVGADVVGNPNCRAINDKVLSIVRDLKPDIVLLHGTWQEHMDRVAETVAMVKQTGARVVVLGGVPFWRRGLPSEALRYYLLRHSLLPVRYKGDIARDGHDAVLRERLVPLGAEFISAREALCNAEGCLTRTGDSAADISTSDQIHLTAGGSAFLIDAIIDRLLGAK